MNAKPTVQKLDLELRRFRKGRNSTVSRKSRRDEDARPAAVEAAVPHVCELCGRAKPLTFHHLIPKAMHGKTRYRKRYTKEEMHTRGLMVCRLCHNGIHDLIEEKQLGEEFNTKEKLLTHEPLLKHIAWVKKQK